MEEDTFEEAAIYYETTVRGIDEEDDQALQDAIHLSQMQELQQRNTMDFNNSDFDFDREFEAAEKIHKRRNEQVERMSVERHSIHCKYNDVDDECSICMNVFKKNDKLAALSCSHYHCKSCLEQWLEISKTCPICRKSPGEEGISQLVLQ